MTRILVATDHWFPDFRGGTGRVAAETARRLAARGHDVTVLAPAVADTPAAQSEEGVAVLRQLPRGALPQTMSDTISTWRLARGLFGSFDVLIGHQPTVALGLAAAYRQVPLVCVYHASGVRETMLRAKTLPVGVERTSARVLAVALAGLERAAMHRAQRVLVLSDYSRSQVTHDHRGLGDRVVAVSGGVDTEEFSPGRDTARAALGVPDDITLLVSVRRLEVQLGLEPLLRAFERLALDEKTRLVIVGDGSLRARLHALGEELGLGERLRLVGSPSEEMLQQWYRAADLFVLPPAPHEGFGMATIEALASGTPAVAARVGANPELLTPLEPRLLARSAAPDDLAAAIADALTLVGPELRRRCRDYALSRFAWDKVIQDWEKAVVEVAQPLV